MPTLLSLCGGFVPAHVQGRDLASTISGGPCPKVDDGVFVETSRGEVGLRTATHTYGIRVDPKCGTVLDDQECFYDLRSDPYQLSNLRDARRDEELAAGLRDRVLAWHHDTPWMQSGVFG